jgi:hypothetical protein
MPFYIVETWVNLYDKMFVGLVDVPDATTDIKSFVSQQLRLSTEKILNVSKCEFSPGEYLPRMARPQLITDYYINVPGKGPLYISGENMASTLPHDPSALANSVNQLTILVHELDDVMRFIQPDKTNLHCYGHHTRNALLLAAMEFENECKGILREHDYLVDRFNTNDFVKLAFPLRLAEYTIQLSHYPGLDPISPFKGWNSDAPTQSLPWYYNYNACKHDRERDFEKGNLLSAINAVCAVAIMLTAQYRIIDTWRDQIGEFFQFREHPKWEQGQHVLPPADGNSWTPLHHQF